MRELAEGGSLCGGESDCLEERGEEEKKTNIEKWTTVCARVGV